MVDPVINWQQEEKKKKVFHLFFHPKNNDGKEWALEPVQPFSVLCVAAGAFRLEMEIRSNKTSWKTTLRALRAE